MAKNDKLLVDGIIDDRINARVPSDDRGEVFEFFALEQIMKDYDLSTDELASGMIDGRQDGGIDGFFVMVNGHLLQDPESFMWPRAGSDLRLVLTSCKHHDTFSQATLDALIATLSELMDFAVQDDDLVGSYSDALLSKRRNLMFAYRRLSPKLESFSASIYYASRGDTSDLGEEVASRGAQIAALMGDHFGTCVSDFVFLGATELIERHRKTANCTLELPFVEALSKGERYVVLARISDYYNFVSDDGHLRRYLFESNVRDFMGLNRVNEDIKATLEAADSPDFWWLNNGVTVLATSAAITGKSIKMADVQIVNGLQTTESVFRHFRERGLHDDERCVLVKVIVSNEEAIRDAIVRATNNQTDVELASLHATDKIQRDIEDVLLRDGLYYERKKNFYANQGHSSSLIVTPLYLAAGYVALVMKAPQRAVTLRSKFMRAPQSYEEVFSPRAPLEVWPAIARVLKRVDAELEGLRPPGRGTERFLKSWRYIVSLCLVSDHLGCFTFSAKDLASYDLGGVTREAVEAVWRELRGQEASGRGRDFSSWENTREALETIAASRGIAGIEAVPRRVNLSTGNEPRARQVTDAFVNRVRDAMPPQPWKPGLHREVCAQLKCSLGQYFTAVERLIDDGVFLRQRDGVLYDPDGNVVSVDLDRVDPATLELRDTDQ